MKKRFLAAFLFALTIISLFSCGKVEKYTGETFAMDTYMVFTCYGENGKAASDEVEKLIKSVENDFGVSSKSGFLYKLNENGSLDFPPEDLVSMLELSKELYELTSGAYDVTVLPVISLWGFDRTEKRVPEDDEISSALALVGEDKITVSDSLISFVEGQKADLGSLAKGLAAEKALEILKEKEIDCAVLSLGGNVQTYGQKPDGSDFSIGIADPFSPEKLIGTVYIKGSKAIVTSGTYQRYFEKDGKTYHHILDARTGRPAESDLVSVTVITESGLLADGYSTALFLLGSEKASDFLKTSPLEAILITCDGKIIVTDGIKDVFKPADVSAKAEVIKKPKG